MGMSVRLRGLLNLFLNFNMLVKNDDPARWIALLLVYLGTLGSILTAILAAFAGAVVTSSNTVPRPHALPILSPALEKVFMSYPQLYYGLGLHGHIITGLYMLFTGIAVSLALAFTLDPELKKYLSSGNSYVDLIDCAMLIAVFATGALPSLLGLHRILGWLWIIVSAVLGGLVRRTVIIAFTSIYQLIWGSPAPGRLSESRDPWLKEIIELEY